MRSVAAALIVLGLSATAAAQQTNVPAGTTPTQEPAIDVDRLPLDLKRIQKELTQNPTVTEEREGLRLRYQIQIYGTAPPFQFFGEDANLVNGPVPYGAPTHREMLYQMTPLPFRAPVADFSALIRWLADRNKNKK